MHGRTVNKAGTKFKPLGFGDSVAGYTIGAVPGPRSIPAKAPTPSRIWRYRPGSARPAGMAVGNTSPVAGPTPQPNPETVALAHGSWSGAQRGLLSRTRGRAPARPTPSGPQFGHQGQTGGQLQK